MNVHWLPVDDGTTTYGPTADRSALANRKHRGNDPVTRHLALDVTFDAINLGINGVAQSCSSLCDHIQHRLNIRRRAGYDAQYFTRRGLLLQRLFEFSEEPDVLDGDHGLVGEGFEKSDLFVCEGPDFCPPKSDHSDDGTLPQHRNCEDCSDLSTPLTLGPTVFRVCQDVMDVNHSPLQCGPPRR